MAEKKCTKCGEIKPLSEFHPQKNCKNGRRPDCRDCHNKASLAYRQENAPALRAYHSAYRTSHLEEKRAKDSAYYEKNRGKWKTYKAVRLADPLRRAKFLASQYKWRRENKDAVNVWTRNRRAKLKSLSGTHTKDDVKRLMYLQRGKCAYCRRDIGKAFHVDHIIPVNSGGSNDVSNLQLLCGPCNVRKGYKDPIAFMQARGFLL